MRIVNRALAAAVVATAVVAVLVAPAPAGAESVTLTDPVGDADGYDISKVLVHHKPKRIGFELHQDGTPYWYEIRVDTPGPRRYRHVVTWSVYTPRKVYVQTRHAHEHGGDMLCVLKNAKVAGDNSLVTFTVPRHCLGSPKSVRVKAIAWDDQFGWMDRTVWTDWAGVA